MTDEYRCNETLDLEDYLENQKHTKADIVVHWNSGREEIISCLLRKDGSLPKVMSDRIGKYRVFPTVKKVEVKYS